MLASGGAAARRSARARENEREPAAMTGARAIWIAIYRCGNDVQPRVQSSAGAGGTAPMKVTASKKPSLGG